MKLLIIEDEKKLSDSIVTYLSGEKYLCEQAFNFQDAMLKVKVYDYDCILLDLMLPGGDGLDILREIRAGKPSSPSGEGLGVRTAMDSGLPSSRRCATIMAGKSTVSIEMACTTLPCSSRNCIIPR